MGNLDFRDWNNGWIKNGNFISYLEAGIKYYERVVMRDLGHYEYPWGNNLASPVTIDAGEPNGPVIPELLEVTKGYNEKTALNRIWQMIFGIKGQVYIYVELPTDLKRHGVPARPWPSTAIRRVAHFTESMSPYYEPTFLTEHFMKRLETYRIEFEAYNPNAIDQTDVWLNIFLNKMSTERIGTESYGPTGLQLTPPKGKEHFQEVLEKLHKRLVPCRPITIMPVRAPAEASAGE